MIELVLLCHHATPTAVRGVRARLQPRRDGGLTLAYAIDATAADLQIPAIEMPQRRAELWRHTCFELFAAGSGTSYREMNFSPSSSWAVYDFSDCRSGMQPAAVTAVPEIMRHPTRLEFTVTLDASLLQGARTGQGVLAVSAVIEERDSRLSYWAVHHPSSTPDFHHRDGFVVSRPLISDCHERA